jgi:hypothetical protein
LNVAGRQRVGSALIREAVERNAKFTAAFEFSGGTGVHELQRDIQALGTTTRSSTTMGASSEPRNVWPAELVAESIASMVRTVTIVLSGIVTVMGCGGGGGGGVTGAGKAGGGAACVESTVGVARAGADAGAGAGGSAAGFLSEARLSRGGLGAAGAGGRFCAEVSTGGAGGAMDLESMTCFTPRVCEAMFRAARRAASSGAWPVRVTMPYFVDTLIEADFSNASANILAWISVVIVASFALLQAKQTSNVRDRKKSSCFRNMKPPCRPGASRGSGGWNRPAGRGALHSTSDAGLLYFAVCQKFAGRNQRKQLVEVSSEVD